MKENIVSEQRLDYYDDKIKSYIDYKLDKLSETDTEKYLKLTGGTMSGAIEFANGDKILAADSNLVLGCGNNAHYIVLDEDTKVSHTLYGHSKEDDDDTWYIESGGQTGNFYTEDTENSDSSLATTEFVHNVVDKELYIDPFNGHEYVDLGLPSGTLWATMNIGATSDSDYGDYFAWGETSPKSDYSWSTYKFGSTPNKYTSSDGKTVLDAEDDAAHVNWGGDWRMPTTEEQDELRNTSYTTWTWTSKGGHNGYLVTSNFNGNSIFLPAADYRDSTDSADVGSLGCYWSSSLYSDSPYSAYLLNFNSGSQVWSNSYVRFNGLPVRAVCYKELKEKYLPTSGGIITGDLTINAKTNLAGKVTSTADVIIGDVSDKKSLTVSGTTRTGDIVMTNTKQSSPGKLKAGSISCVSLETWKKNSWKSEDGTTVNKNGGETTETASERGGIKVGTVDCANLTANNDSVFKGKLTAELSLSVKGEASTVSLNVSNSAIIGADLTTSGNIKTEGTLRAKDSLSLWDKDSEFTETPNVKLSCDRADFYNRINSDDPEIVLNYDDEGAYSINALKSIHSLDDVTCGGDDVKNPTHRLSYKANVSYVNSQVSEVSNLCSALSGKLNTILSTATTALTVAQKHLCPTGTVTLYAGTEIPDGWLVCDGSTIAVAYDAHVALDEQDLEGVFNINGTVYMINSPELQSGCLELAHLLLNKYNSEWDLEYNQENYFNVKVPSVNSDIEGFVYIIKK